MRLVDLSVPIVDGLPVDPPVQIPKIEYTDHDESVDEMLTFFPAKIERASAGWARVVAMFED